MKNKNSKNRLLQITHDLAIGGLQQVVLDICKNINKDIFDVSVLCLRRKGELAPEIEKLGFKVFTIPTKEEGGNRFAFRHVATLLRRGKFDIIHTHNGEPFVDGTLGAILAGCKTIVHTEHGREYPDKWRYMFEERIMSLFAYKVVGVSEDTSRNLIKYVKISPKKIVTINNGIDLSKYKIEIDKQNKINELGIEKRGPIIGLGVRLSRVKGISYLLKAMPVIIKKFPEITLVIAGDGPIRKQLQDESHSLKISDNVRFIGSRFDMPEILKLFDIYILPSISEGLPLVLLEAMAAGCSVIASNVGGIPSVINHNDNGILVNPKNRKALEKEILTLLTNKDLRDKYALNAMKLVDEKYSAKIMTAKYEQLYLRKQL